MAVEVKMPQMSDTMNEGKILKWLVSEGDSISRGDALLEVQTDKADLEVEAFDEGTLLKIHAPEGSTVQVGSVIAVIGSPGESVGDSSASSTTKAQPNPEPQPDTAEPKTSSQPKAAPQPAAQPTNGATGDRIKISPLARNFAEAQGIDYSALKGRGSGEGGRIVKQDIEQYLGSAKPAPKPAAQAGQPAASPRPVPQGAAQIPLSSMRQTIASRMVSSMTEIPHFYMTSKIVMDECVR
ncbi:MAG: E3 binding domain-containing protein, partial [Bdellovibrionales bacterium]|nr:E3 binding domain-containing protein [Bdellovibrionales bacterium]